MNRQDYIQNYLTWEHQRMASHLLPDETHSKEEWDSLWQRVLNSPAH